MDIIWVGDSDVAVSGELEVRGWTLEVRDWKVAAEGLEGEGVRMEAKREVEVKVKRGMILISSPASRRSPQTSDIFPQASSLKPQAAHPSQTAEVTK
jgi:hypothetical protein